MKPDPEICKECKHPFEPCCARCGWAEIARLHNTIQRLEGLWESASRALAEKDIKLAFLRTQLSLRERP